MALICERGQMTEYFKAAEPPIERSSANLCILKTKPCCDAASYGGWLNPAPIRNLQVSSLAGLDPLPESEEYSCIGDLEAG